MYRTTTINFYPVHKLQEVHQLIRQNDIESAIKLFSEENSGHASEANDIIKEEARFLQIIDKSYSYSAEGSDGEVSARSALLYGTLFAHKGNWDNLEPQPGMWQCPFNKDGIVGWAASYYPGATEDLEAVFDALVIQGLFFEIHPEVFDRPYYYCSFDTEFFTELPRATEIIDFIDEEFVYANSEEGDGTWRHTGICAGQGHQGGGSSWLPCVGTSCVWFSNGDSECIHSLKFNPTLLESYRKRKQST